MPLLEGRTVVVSGVGPGLGQQIAVRAAREGANVVLGARTEENLAKVGAEIAAAQNGAGQSGAAQSGAGANGAARVAWRSTDIADDDACRALAALAVERFGRIDAVIHVAALDSYFGGLADADFASWRQVLDVNLIGTLQLTRACLPALRERGGSVVIIGTQSAVASPSQVKQAAYAASKGALTSAMYSLARELGPDRIRVNTVVPGWMWGPAVEIYVRWTAGTENVTEEEVRSRLAERMALPELASDGDVAEAALFFASDRAKSITGQSLLVNAGELMR